MPRPRLTVMALSQFTSRMRSRLDRRSGPTGPTREPLVIGVLGSNHSGLQTLAADSTELTCAIDVPGLQLNTNGPVRRQRTLTHSLHTWAALDPTASFVDPRSARDEAGAIGVFVDRKTGSVELFGDALGVWPLFYLERNGSVVFSNRLDPMLQLCERPTLDRVSWAALASLRYVPPGRSVVEEVRTLFHGESISFDPNSGRIKHRIDTPPLTADGDATPEDLIEAIQTVLAAHEGGSLFLSGGFDSRLLAACAVDAGIDIACLTTEGAAGDVDVAPTVAVTLGVPLVEVPGDSSDWITNFTEMTRRMDYATTQHPWAAQLGGVARSRDMSAIAGMGGGILLNSHLQTTDEETNRLVARTAQMGRIGAASLRRTEFLADWVIDTADVVTDEFVAATEPYADRSDWQALTILTTRTARSITAMMTRGTGPEIPVAMPYLAPRVMAAALSPEIHLHRSDNLHRDIQRRINPELAELPVGRDLPTPDISAVHPGRQPNTIERMVEAIALDDVACSMLSSNLRRLVTSHDIPKLTKLASCTDAERALHAALLLAALRSVHPEAAGVVLSQ